MRSGSTILGGRYEVLDKIAQGGMGAVYRVRHRLLEEVRVAKVILGEHQDQEHAHERFTREARAASRLRHPNVAQLYDFFTDDDGTSYIVMEYIEGKTLQVLAQSAPVPHELVAEIGLQTLNALGYLHRQGMVHRDVAPDNLMLSVDADLKPEVKIIDLGIAKSDKDGDGSLTQDGSFLGKVGYASPEHFKVEQRVDARSDLYSLGVVLYELATGQHPIVGDELLEKVAGHIHYPPRSFDETDPHRLVPTLMAEAITRCLEKEPERRFQDAQSFALALAEASPTVAATRLSSPPSDGEAGETSGRWLKQQLDGRDDTSGDDEAPTEAVPRYEQSLDVAKTIQLTLATLPGPEGQASTSATTHWLDTESHQRAGAERVVASARAAFAAGEWANARRLAIQGLLFAHARDAASDLLARIDATASAGRAVGVQIREAGAKQLEKARDAQRHRKLEEERRKKERQEAQEKKLAKKREAEKAARRQRQLEEEQRRLVAERAKEAKATRARQQAEEKEVRARETQRRKQQRQADKKARAAEQTRLREEAGVARRERQRQAEVERRRQREERARVLAEHKKRVLATLRRVPIGKLAVTMVVLTMAVVAIRSYPSAPVARGDLVIDATPWAEVLEVRAADSEVPVELPADRSTPLRLDGLGVGHYLVTLKFPKGDVRTVSASEVMVDEPASVVVDGYDSLELLLKNVGIESP